MTENNVPTAKPSFLRRLLSCSVIVLTVGILACFIALPFLPMILKPIVGDIFRRGYDTFYITDSLRVCASRGRLPENWTDLKIGFDAIYGESYPFEGFDDSDAFYADMTTRIDVNFELFQKINRHLDDDATTEIPVEIPEDERWVFHWKDRRGDKKFQRERFDELLKDVKRYAAQRREHESIEKTDNAP